MKSIRQKFGVGNANLQGYWETNNNWNDSSASGYTLTPRNTPTFNVGMFGYSAAFSVNQYSDIADASATGLRIAGDKTYVCWVKCTDFAAQNAFLFKSDSGASEFVGIRTDTTTGLVTFYNKITEAISSDVALTAGAWTLVAGIGDVTNNKIRVYVGGTMKEATGATNSANPSGMDFAMGRLGGISAAYMAGDIADAAVFNRCLTTAELDDLRLGVTSGFFNLF